MSEKKYWLVCVEQGSERSTSRMRLDEIAAAAGMHPGLVERFFHLGLIDPVAFTVSQEPLFAESTVAVVRKIRRLRRQLGINYVGIGVVLELLERIDELESRLRELEDRLEPAWRGRTGM